MEQIPSHYVESEPGDDLKNMRLGEKRDVTPRQDGGVMKEVLEEGDGDFYANLNDKVTLLYTAYVGDVVADEYIFDSSERDGKPFTFSVLKGQVVRGFEMAVMTMKKGERSMITLTPMYAFGKAGAPPRVPANTNVMFETTIISIDPEDLSPEQDKSIIKHVLKKGKGWDAPHEGGQVTVSCKGFHGDRVFLDIKEQTYPFGEGSTRNIGIPEFLEEFFMEYKRGELAELRLDAKHCWGSKGCPDREIPPDANLVFHIHIHEFTRGRDVWELDERERLVVCDEHKKKGNDYYRRAEFALARKFYQKVIDNLEFDLLMTGEDEERRKQLLSDGFLNLAQAYLKEENYAEVKRCCDKVLDRQPNNVKALYRKAMANYFTQDYDDALEDFQQVVELDPDNKSARKKIILCLNKSKATHGNERQMYQRMFTSSTDGSSESDFPSSGMEDISHWDNSMAQGMMSLEEEARAWDDQPPPKGDNNHGHH